MDRAYIGINSIPKNIKVRKKAKKSYFNEMKNENKKINKKSDAGSGEARTRDLWIMRSSC